ncbi:hypothetical protein EPN29_00515 [bacterium]|nr:MAG: hypothetical protein EPN29_00515 [bacterium]
MFALAVDPTDNQLLIAANSEGTLMRSADGGSTWDSVHTGRASVDTLAFSPFKAGLVLAGTRGAGALASRDGGLTWSTVSGLDGRTARVFAFSLTVMAAGTDHGVYVSQDGLSWSPSGLADRSIDAIAVAAIHSPVRLIAGSDSPASGGGLPMFQSTDGGASWTSLNAAISGTAVLSLAAGPLPPTKDVRPLLVGTNAGLFVSTDNGASFTALSGGGLLPSTDYTQLAFVTDHHDRFYVASDGGGSRSGGVWRTDDAGRSFTSLAPPEPSITALAVAYNQTPILYAATFGPADHAAALWAYHDTGAPPQGSTGSPPPHASGSRTATASPGVTPSLLALLQKSQTPYVALGVGALVVIALAMVANFRGGRR